MSRPDVTGASDRVRRAALVSCLAFTVEITAAISIVDARGGGLLAQYFEEYAGGGSCKWRGEDGRSFQRLLEVGLLAWPAGLGAVAASLRGRSTNPGDRARRVRRFVVRVLVVLVVALAFARLASLHAVAGARGWC